MRDLKAAIPNRIGAVALLFVLLILGFQDAFAQPSGSESFPAPAIRTTLFQSPADLDASRLQSLTSSSPRKALLLSFLLPGLGHRYTNGGSWSGWATAFALSDAALWITLIGGEWRHDHLVNSFTTLAASQAGASTGDKDRTFFLNLATYMSSEEFLETVLRNRAWDQVDYVDDPSFQWSWSSPENFERFRSLRGDAETLRRRRTIVIASLVANRLISGILAARRSGRTGGTGIELSLGPPAIDSANPTAVLRIRY